MLVPRYLRRGVRERVVSRWIDQDPDARVDVRNACELFLREGVEAVAVSFVWSVLNPAHERRAAEIVREMMPHAALTIGGELCGDREYTRTSTAVTSAYLTPVLSRYIEAVDRYFRSLGAQYPVRFFSQTAGWRRARRCPTAPSTRSTRARPRRRRPGARSRRALPSASRNVITVDMGGTSFDITLTKDGQTNLNKNIDFLRYRIGVPMIQVETLGAGGGSIGWTRCCSGFCRWGPQSSRRPIPGLACYRPGRHASRR